MTSRLPGFYRLSLSQRRAALAPLEEVLLEEGGLTTSQADELGENVVGRYALPLSIATNFIVDGEERLVPMATEEPSVVAACSNGARVARVAGGFTTSHEPPVTTCQLLLRLPPSTESDSAQRQRLLRTLNHETLLRSLGALDPQLVAHGGGPRSLELSPHQMPGCVTLLLHVVTQDAMGANSVNTMGEALLEQLKPHYTPVAAILTNAMPQRNTTAAARFPVTALGKGGVSSEKALDRFLQLVELAQRDPMRAVTHNKGILNGISAVALATGNDTRGVEAAAHYHAASQGSYRPLSTWSLQGKHLVGQLSLPLPLGTVGGMTTHHPLSAHLLERFALLNARTLAAVAACAGLANNFSALWALSTEGIQKGHMLLQKKRR